MRILPAVVLVSAAFVTPLAFSQAQAPQVSGAVASSPGKGTVVRWVTAKATVESTDPATRAVVLKTANGETHSVVAGPEVRNFDQIKPGDTVAVKYAESFTLELKKDGKALVARTENAGVNRSQPGQKPGGSVAREVSVVADVVGVDPKTQHISLKGPDGNVVDLPIGDPEQFKLVKKGDQVQATYTEAIAVALTPSSPAKAAPKADGKK
jgi:hypothetical protein